MSFFCVCGRGMGGVGVPVCMCVWEGYVFFGQRSDNQLRLAIRWVTVATGATIPSPSQDCPPTHPHTFVSMFIVKEYIALGWYC